MNKKTFHLRWNNHLQNLQSLFENLYNEQCLVDVTISCSDGLLYGHKLVLSACSPYFEQVFRDNPCKHPIMILKGIKQHDMQVLLEYMYMGAVDVGEEDLEMLLDIAAELQIKGLVQSREENPIFHKSTDPNRMTRPCKDSSNTATQNSHHDNNLSWQAELVAQPSSSKYKENGSFIPQLSNNARQESIEETKTSNDREMSLHNDNEIEFKPIYSDQEIDDTIVMKEEYEENSEESRDCIAIEPQEDNTKKQPENYNFQESKNSGGDDTNFFCHFCTRAFPNKGSYHRHMLTHAGVKPHQCSLCNQSFLRLSHLQRHIRVHTGERPYSCAECPKQFARSDKLRQHYIIQHHTSNNSPNKTSKPRGRPRKNPGIIAQAATSSSLNSVYALNINAISVSSSTSVQHS